MDFVDKQGSSAGTSAHHPWWDEVRYSNNPVVGQSPAPHQHQHQCSVLPSAASTPTPRHSTRMLPSPSQLRYQPHHQQQQQLHRFAHEHSDPSSSRIVSPGSVSMATATGDAAASVATVVTSSEIDWLNQQLTDIQQLRRHSQLNGGDGRAEQREEVNVNNAELRQDQEVGDNASNIQAARPHSAAASPCRHGNRHHRRRHHRRRRYHRRRHSPTSFSSRTSSSLSNTRDGSSAGSASSSSSTDSESESSRSSHAAAAADAVGAASRSFAAMPKQVDSGLGGGPSIESVYTNFLSISQRLSSLISEYYSGAAPLDFKSQQQPPPLPPPPPTRQLSLVASRSTAAAIYQGDDTPEEKSPNNPVASSSLILPSPLRRSMSNRRREQGLQQQQQRVQLPPPPRPLPPLPQIQQHQQQQRQHQPESRASKKERKEKSKSRHHHSKSKQQHRSESVAGGSGSNSKGGFGSRIRASLSKKFSPRQRHTQQDEQSAVAEEHLQQQQKQHENFNQKKELASRPTATTTAAASGAASSTVDYPRSNIGREAAVNEAASATKESSTTALAAAAAVSAAGESARQPVGLDSRVPLLFSDSQPADPCLAKLQRLRATVLDLVQRSVDPVLKSLRDIQSAGTGGGAKAAPQTAGAGVATEVSATLADVMSLMELLSRSVMLVSMHNLDPNSLKLVYLSSSYIRSLKRLSKGLQASDLVASAGGTADEAAAGDAEDADRVSRLEL
ncbi:hypothetical protein BOX15_Mlig028028g1 [Macrostomum lignano]|uniref:Uncharacterized protein n=1 Tax=Macrostomum lignano TaxID=282301 RepID=A0A267FYS8_9PLAT|nr:hypothetical protein BOX15_Mlig028028g1 [Macrostomum lignano]